MYFSDGFSAIRVRICHFAGFYGNTFVLKAMTPNFHVVIDFMRCPLFTSTTSSWERTYDVELNINHLSQNK